VILPVQSECRVGPTLRPTPFLVSFQHSTTHRSGGLTSKAPSRLVHRPTRPPPRLHLLPAAFTSLPPASSRSREFSRLSPGRVVIYPKGPLVYIHLGRGCWLRQVSCSTSATRVFCADMAQPRPRLSHGRADRAACALAATCSRAAGNDALIERSHSSNFCGTPTKTRGLSLSKGFRGQGPALPRGVVARHAGSGRLRAGDRRSTRSLTKEHFGAPWRAALWWRTATAPTQPS